MTGPACPSCQTPEAQRFLRREGVPVQQNLLVASEKAARAVPRGTLDMHVCTSCGFVFNAAFEPALLDYGLAYDNSQSCSPAFDAYMDDLAREIIEQKEIRNARIIEIGCGKGLFLRKLVGWPGAGNTGIGFDTSYDGPATDLGGRLRFERRFYDERAAGEPADAVICRHVIEHVPAPRALMRSVRGALERSCEARLWFETPCVEWILRNEVLWDFFYEHCSLFTEHSLARLFRETGFSVESVRHIFGGQYLWLEARPGAVDAAPAERSKTADLALSYGRKIESLRKAWAKRLSALAAKGPIALWGAGAKGATFANLVDPEARTIACVVDLNPAKQGKFIPGTGHAIIAPEALDARGVRVALVMNPNYRGEIAALTARLSLSLDLLDWSAP